MFHPPSVPFLCHLFVYLFPRFTSFLDWVKLFFFWFFFLLTGLFYDSPLPFFFLFPEHTTPPVRFSSPLLVPDFPSNILPLFGPKCISPAILFPNSHPILLTIFGRGVFLCWHTRDDVFVPPFPSEIRNAFPFLSDWIQPPFFSPIPFSTLFPCSTPWCVLLVFPYSQFSLRFLWGLYSFSSGSPPHLPLFELQLTDCVLTLSREILFPTFFFFLFSFSVTPFVRTGAVCLFSTLSLSHGVRIPLLLVFLSCRVPGF